MPFTSTPLKVDPTPAYLMKMMVAGKKAIFTDSEGVVHTGFLNSISREDGSGKLFVVELDCGYRREIHENGRLVRIEPLPVRVFVRTS